MTLVTNSSNFIDSVKIDKKPITSYQSESDVPFIQSERFSGFVFKLHMPIMVDSFHFSTPPTSRKTDSW